MFSYLGTRHDKHVKEYDIYEIVPSNSEMVFERDSEEEQKAEELDAALDNAAANTGISPRPNRAPAPHSAPAPATPEYQWPPEVLARITKELAGHIGPLAKVLVQRAAKRACSPDDLYKVLSQHLPDGTLRELFLKHAPNGVSAAPAGAASAAIPDTALPTGVPIPDDVREHLRHQLAETQGPLAKVLIKRAAAKSSDYPQFYQMLAKELPESQRSAFIAYAKKLLPEPR